MAALTTRPLVLAAWMVLASNLISTLLSPSIPVSLWGREPALDGNSFYNTLSHFLLFRADLVPRAVSAGSATASTLASELLGIETQVETQGLTLDAIAYPNSIETRLLLWKNSVRMAMDRPWFEFQDPPPPLFLHLYGYGPEFFQYLFPLIHPRKLSHLNNGLVYYGVADAHNITLNRWVELGIFGLAGHFVLLGAVVAIGIWMILDKRTTTQVHQRLAMAAVLASVAGRMAEQLAGIPHLSDEALFGTLLALVAALPMLAHRPLQGGKLQAGPNPSGTPRFTDSRINSPMLQVSLALVKNTNYALAEIRSTSAAASLDDGRPE